MLLKEKAKKIVAGFIACCVLIPSSGSVFADTLKSNETERTKIQIETVQDNITPVSQQAPLNVPIVENQASEVQYGVKSRAVLKVAEALVEQTDKLTSALQYFNVIDGNSARSIKAHRVKLSDKIKSFANFGDSAGQAVREQLPPWLLENTNMSSGTANNIAIGLKYAIKAIDWLI